MIVEASLGVQTLASQGVSWERGEQGASVANITQGVTPFDLTEDRLQQRAWIVARTSVAPELSQIGRGA
jgi:hypothetical protein